MHQNVCIRAGGPSFGNFGSTVSHRCKEKSHLVPWVGLDQNSPARTFNSGDVHRRQRLF